MACIKLVRHFIAYGALGFSVFLNGCKSTVRQEEESEVYGQIAGRGMAEGEVRRVIRQAGFPAVTVNKIVCTAWYESKWHTHSVNRNKKKNGKVTIDYGLLQINSANWEWCGVGQTALADPLVNARCGLKLFKSQGMGAWYGYRSHRTRCDAYRGGRLKLADDPENSAQEEHLSEDRILHGDGSRPDGMDLDPDMQDLSQGEEIPEPVIE
jgi:hypothetical protein